MPWFKHWFADELYIHLYAHRDSTEARQAIDLFQSVTALRPGDVPLLDLACGTGDFCELVEQRGADVIGVDFALQMLKQGRHRGLDFRSVQADGEWLPFRSGSVDVVTCGFALRNLVDLDEVPDEAPERLTFVGVERIEEVLELALQGKGRG